MAKRKINSSNSNEFITFGKKIKQLEMDKNSRMMQLRQELADAIVAGGNPDSLVEKYNKDVENVDKDLTEKIEKLKIKRKEIRKMPIYSETEEGQDEILRWDEVYQYLKEAKNKELLTALKSRKMTTDEYLSLYFGDFSEKNEMDHNLVDEVLRKFASWESSIKVYVWTWKGHKTLNSEWKFRTAIWEDYILGRIQRYVWTFNVRKEILANDIQFPHGVNIIKPEDNLEIPFKYKDLQWTIKIEFMEVNWTEESEINESKEGHVSRWSRETQVEWTSENGEKTSKKKDVKEVVEKRKVTPKELFDCFEQYLKYYLDIDDLKDASRDDIMMLLDCLKDPRDYQDFADTSKKEYLNDLECEFPSDLNTFIKGIAPVKLDEDQLIAVLQSNYKKLDTKEWKLIFDANGFDVVNDVDNVLDTWLKNKYQELGKLYRERGDYNRAGQSVSEEFIMKICKIEREIIDTYYPHLKNVYFKDLFIDRK